MTTRNNDAFAIVEPKPGELEACPFCGSGAAFEHSKTGTMAQWRVYCRDNVMLEDGCPIGWTNTKGYARRVEAATAWNLRVAAPAGVSAHRGDQEAAGRSDPRPGVTPVGQASHPPE